MNPCIGHPVGVSYGMTVCTVDNDFLCKHSMFGGLSDDELNIIRPLLDEKVYAQDTVILHQDAPNSTVYFIVYGDVAIRKHPEEGMHEERDITTLHKGDSFGEMELIDIQPCAASAVCLTEVKVITLTNRDLYMLSKTYPHVHMMIIMNLARDISRRLRSTDKLLALVTKRNRRTN